MNKLILALALLSALLATPVSAKDYVVQVNGIVCGFCSLGVSKKISKLPFIDHSKYEKGVSVEIENQMVTIAVQPDAILDKEALYAAIESGGYNPVEIFELTAEGTRKAILP